MDESKRHWFIYWSLIHPLGGSATVFLMCVLVGLVAVDSPVVAILGVLLGMVAVELLAMAVRAARGWGWRPR